MFDITTLQPMEIYVDDEAKLTLHGLVQVCLSFVTASPHEDHIWMAVLSLFCKVWILILRLRFFNQHYIKLSEKEKNRKLNDLLDALDFNQVVIFVKSVSRAAELNKLLVECNFPSICIHSGMSQEERFCTISPLLPILRSSKQDTCLHTV